MIDDVRELRDREGLLDGVERRDGRIDASLAANPVALDARELDERVRAGRDRGATVGYETGVVVPPDPATVVVFSP